MDKKKKILRILQIVIVCVCSAILLTAIAFLIPKQDGSFNIQSLKGWITAKRLLEGVCNENYDKAFQSLYYYDETIEGGSEVSADAARQIWTDRLSGERHSGFSQYLSDYGDINVYLFNGNLVCTATLTYSIRGVERTEETTLIFFNGKIASVTDEDFSVMYDMEKLLSGRLNIN